jgi:glycosyltransferase involved in cell wall biosynthesis
MKGGKQMDSIKLSILIPTIESRKILLMNLLGELHKQTINYPGNVDVLTETGSGTIGAKRNKLLERATGEYICFIDDDDEVSKDYIPEILKAIESKPDCVSLRGVITWDGANPEIFEHSIKYNGYVTHTIPKGGIKYERYPNHLNAIKSEIAKQFKFPETNHGEDTDWATQVFKSGLLKKEVYIDKVLYNYKFIPNK